MYQRPIKHIKDNMGENLDDFGCSDNILDTVQMESSTKGTT
jgi:hypothetical protein